MHNIITGAIDTFALAVNAPKPAWNPVAFQLSLQGFGDAAHAAELLRASESVDVWRGMFQRAQARQHESEKMAAHFADMEQRFDRELMYLLGLFESVEDTARYH
jgi:hypothetical protein